MMVGTVATIVSSLEYKQEAGSRWRCSLMEQQIQVQIQVKNRQLLSSSWVAAQLPALYSIVECECTTANSKNGMFKSAFELE